MICIYEIRIIVRTSAFVYERVYCRHQTEVKVMQDDFKFRKLLH